MVQIHPVRDGKEQSEGGERDLPDVRPSGPGSASGQATPEGIDCGREPERHEQRGSVDDYENPGKDDEHTDPQGPLSLRPSKREVLPPETVGPDGVGKIAGDERENVDAREVGSVDHEHPAGVEHGSGADEEKPDRGECRPEAFRDVENHRRDSSRSLPGMLEVR